MIERLPRADPVKFEDSVRRPTRVRLVAGNHDVVAVIECPARQLDSAMEFVLSQDLLADGKRVISVMLGTDQVDAPRALRKSASPREQTRIVAELAHGVIALLAEKSAHGACIMVVIDGRRFIAKIRFANCADVHLLVAKPKLFGESNTVIALQMLVALMVAIGCVDSTVIRD
jgi:hypothetical protein